MINVKKRYYIIGLIILTVIILCSTMLIWNLINNNGKQQDKVYSGAKYVYISPQLSITKGDVNV
ncbi:MAG: hypothetical protein GX160_06575 [Clostridiales bacterium]|nr:hypothetical protein [Clostridiales bacterium]